MSKGLPRQETTLNMMASTFDFGMTGPQVRTGLRAWPERQEVLLRNVLVGPQKQGLHTKSCEGDGAGGLSTPLVKINQCGFGMSNDSAMRRRNKSADLCATSSLAT